MLVPAKTKYRKSQKGGKKILGVASNGNSLKFGSFGLKALEPSKLNKISSKGKAQDMTGATMRMSHSHMDGEWP